PHVAGLSPEQQSSCGLIYNGSGTGDPPVSSASKTTGGSPVPHPSFGPKVWEGNAIVCGFSRGKIWRVPLGKIGDTYAGRPHLLAALRVLTLASAIDPKGNLTVITHSGEPDWGTGPGGAGRIFKISYTDRAAPQPVLAWAEGPTDVRVAFDRPVEPNFLGDLTKVSIAYGEYVRAGDRFEVLKPPYEVVAQQGRAYRGELRVTA